MSSDPLRPVCFLQFQKYEKWFENELQDFCESQRISGAQLQEAVRKSLAEEESRSGARFFPLFMQFFSYVNFLTEMKSRAEELNRRTIPPKIERDISSDRSINITGEWFNDPTELDPEKVKRMMNLVGLPWLFRKLFMRVSRSRNIRLSIVQNEEGITITSKFRFFGSAKTVLRWNRPRKVYNFWRRLVTCEARLRKDEVAMIMTDVDYYPEGASVVHTWHLEESGRRLVLILGVDLPDGTAHRLRFVMSNKKIGK